MADPSEAVKKLYDELGQPSVTKLMVAAKKRGIPITKTQAQAVQADVKQLFAKELPQRGAIATNEAGAVVQIDLIDFSQYSSKNNKNHTYVLIAVDVFSRKVYTEALESKRP